MAKKYFRKAPLYKNRYRLYDSINEAVSDRDRSLDKEVFGADLILEGTISAVMVPTNVLELPKQEHGAKKDHCDDDDDISVTEDFS